MMHNRSSGIILSENFGMNYNRNSVIISRTIFRNRLDARFLELMEK